MTARYPLPEREGPKGSPGAAGEDRWRAMSESDRVIPAAAVALVGPLAVLLVIVVGTLGFLLGRL